MIEQQRVKPERFLSLDVFRGATICLMIFVNTPGSGAKIYPYLAHAQWFGFTLADLVFPSFLFAVGNSMSFSMQKYMEGDPLTFWKKVIRRTFLIFLLGFLMYWYPFFEVLEDGSWALKPFSETRIMGVLQRIALCYFFASVMIKYCSEKAILIISGLILLIYWAILYLFGEPGAELEMATNAAAKFDLSILGLGHIYKRDLIPFDPEGILSTLPAIVNVVAGYLTGVYVKRVGKTFEGVSVLLVAGFLLTSLALWWELIFPISKKLWTSSFVLYTVGIDLSLIAVLIFGVELKNIRFSTHFFSVFGKNPLIIYLFSEIFYITIRLIQVGGDYDAFEWVSINIFQAIFPGPFGAFMTAVFYMLLCWILGWWMDRKKIYIKL